MGSFDVTEAPAGSESVVEFGTFEFDRASRELRRRGRRVHLQSQPVRVLEQLLARPGELVTRDVLRQTLWPDHVYVDFEHGLNNAIARLREALGDDAAAPRFIETVPRHGYRFVHPVRARSEAEPPEPTPPSRAARRPDPRTIGRGAGVILFAAALAALGWWWAGRDPLREIQAPPITAPSPMPLLESVAVLPFEFSGQSVAGRRLADGIAASVRLRLADIPELTLTAPSSALRFDGRTDTRDVARALNVSYLVQGSVTLYGGQNGDHARVIVALVDGETGSQQFSQRFDFAVADVVEHEADIASSVAAALDARLTRSRHAYSRFGTDAYLSFLQGRALVASYRIADAERAIEQFTRAIEVAPDFAAAYVALGDAHRHLGYLEARGPGRSPLGRRSGPQGAALREGALRAEPMLAEALRLDADLGEAYVLRADLEAIRGDAAAAEADYRKGLALSPHYAAGHRHFAEFLERQGRLDESEAMLDRAISLDPLSPWSHYYKGFMQLFSEETEVFSAEAERRFLGALELNPDFHPAIVPIAAIRWYQGRFAEALRLAERALAIDPRAGWIRWFLVEFYLEVDDPAAARDVLSAPEVRPIQWLALCHYEGAIEEAAALLRADPHSRGFADNDVEAYVLRDAARANGELGRGVRELVELPSRPGLDVGSDPFRLVTLAQLELERGNSEESHRYARQMLEFRDRRSRSGHTLRLANATAAALAVLERDDEALALLEEGFARGFRKRWWYTFERDPALLRLQSAPRFLALADAARAHSAQEQRRVQDMRARGELPQRQNDLADARCPAPPEASHSSIRGH